MQRPGSNKRVIGRNGGETPKETGPKIERPGRKNEPRELESRFRTTSRLDISSWAITEHRGRGLEPAPARGPTDAYKGSLNPHNP